MIKAYSYIRFSTAEQEKGHSLQRQLTLSKEYAKSNNLDLDTSLKMQDLGISAYSGANITNGALGSFINAINDGTVEKGSYLLVESLDRLSRQKVTQALTQFIDILNKQIIIVTLTDNKKYDAQDLNEMDLMFSLMIMSRAHEESKTKSLRIQSAWDNKHKNINTLKLTSWAPKWVYLSEDRKSFLLHEDRVEIVKNIFHWAELGLGNNLIVQRLENGDIAPWGSINSNEPKRREPKRWYISYIQRILADRSVLGEFTSKRKSKNGETEVIQNYFPKIIDENLFYRVQHLRASRNVNKTGHGAGRKGKSLSNIFSGILYCGYSLANNKGRHQCDGSNEKFQFTNKGGHLTYLQCARIKSGSSGCRSCRKMWRYDVFETSFLSHINDIDASTLLGRPSDIDKKIQQSQAIESSILGELATIETTFSKLSDAIERTETISDFLLEQIAKNEDKKSILEKELESVKSKLVNLTKDRDSALAVDTELKEMISLMQSANNDEIFDIRLKLSEIIKQSIQKIVLYSSGQIQGEQFLDRVQKELGQEAKELLLLNQKINKSKPQPFYEVFYKSGLSRIIYTNPKDPTKLRIEITSQDDEWIEMTDSLTGEVNTTHRNSS